MGDARRDHRAGRRSRRRSGRSRSAPSTSLPARGGRAATASGSQQFRRLAAARSSGHAVSGRRGREGGRARAHRVEAADALPGRARREAAGARAKAARTACATAFSRGSSSDRRIPHCMGYSVNSLDALGEGYGFRKVRAPLGVTAFGVNGIVFPPRLRGSEPLPRHAGRALLRPPRHGEVHRRRRGARRRGGRARARRVDDAAACVSNRTDEDLVLLVVGGKGGYVERDGQLVEPGRPRQAAGDAEELP